MQHIRNNQKWISMMLILALFVVFFSGALFLIKDFNSNLILQQKNDTAAQSLLPNFTDILGFNPQIDLIPSGLSKSNLEQLKQSSSLITNAINFADRLKYNLIYIFFLIFMLSICMRMRTIVNFIHKIDGQKGGKHIIFI